MQESYILQEVLEKKRNNSLNMQWLKDAYIKVLSVKHLTVHQYTYEYNENTGNLVYNPVTIYVHAHMPVHSMTSLQRNI
jgi:hypothetical protein